MNLDFNINWEGALIVVVIFCVVIPLTGWVFNVESHNNPRSTTDRSTGLEPPAEHHIILLSSAVVLSIVIFILLCLYAKHHSNQSNI